MGTIVHDPFFAEVPAFLGLTFDELIAVKHPTAWIEFELGRIDESSFLPTFFRDGRGYDQQGLKRTMRDAYAYLDGMEQLLGELVAAGLRMHALSNYTDWYTLIEERLALSRYVPWTFVSCRTGLRKPEPAAYEHAAHALRVRPGDCVFVDDRGANCAAARGVGMHAIQFRDANQLRAELVAAGVL